MKWKRHFTRTKSSLQHVIYLFIFLTTVIWASVYPGVDVTILRYHCWTRPELCHGEERKIVPIVSRGEMDMQAIGRSQESLETEMRWEIIAIDQAWNSKVLNDLGVDGSKGKGQSHEVGAWNLTLTHYYYFYKMLMKCLFCAFLTSSLPENSKMESLDTSDFRESAYC